MMIYNQSFDFFCNHFHVNQCCSEEFLADSESLQIRRWSSQDHQTRFLVKNDLGLGCGLVDSFTSLIPRFELSRMRHQSEPGTQSYSSIQQHSYIPSSHQSTH